MNGAFKKVNIYAEQAQSFNDAPLLHIALDEEGIHALQSLG